MYISAPANRASVSYVPIEQIPFLVPAHSTVNGLGLELEPKTLALGVGFLMLGLFLFRFDSRPKYEKRQRREAQTRKLRQQIQRLERAE